MYDLYVDEDNSVTEVNEWGDPIPVETFDPDHEAELMMNNYEDIGGDCGEI